jgi:hypothetical protein
MKIHPVELSYSMCTDRWTDMMKLMVAFHNFVYVLKNEHTLIL